MKFNLLTGFPTKTEQADYNVDQAAKTCLATLKDSTSCAGASDRLRMADAPCRRHAPAASLDRSAPSAITSPKATKVETRSSSFKVTTSTRFGMGCSGPERP